MFIVLYKFTDEFGSSHTVSQRFSIK